MPSLKDVPEGACPENRAYCSDFKLGSDGKCAWKEYAVAETEENKKDEL